MRKEEKVWDRFSRVYDRIIKKDEAAYRVMVDKMVESIGQEEKVLEIATGTGVLALPLSKKISDMVAIDFSEKMIETAKKKAEKMNVENVKFEVQDACSLSFYDNVFDVVIISNALHIMPNPESVLSEIKRVLKKDGRLIAPTFIHKRNKRAWFFSKLTAIFGFKTCHVWDQSTYCQFLAENGFDNINSTVLNSSFDIAYATACIKNK